ncbi:unnamed protein product [Rotaria magnacalcarata]|uniref:Uncharacterized protein n=3 Tax=Rotaria magnacalcarata TaxID=392030 RepID=A0A816S2Z4_9BILA|nr:unnamed protein product [Rotaria magnacalcarata]CAF2080001.1 unnamed protein product [Rotaria magnacalcarata]
MRYVKKESDSVHYTKLNDERSNTACGFRSVVVAVIVVIIVTCCCTILWRFLRVHRLRINSHVLKLNFTASANCTTLDQSENLVSPQIEKFETHYTSQLFTAMSAVEISEQSSTHTTVFVQSVMTTTVTSNDVDICATATWATDGISVAGGQGAGKNLNQLYYPRGTFVDDTGALYITDDNLRVMKWKHGTESGVMVAGFGGRGNGSDQFEYYLHNLAVDTEGTMYICDKGNERVVRWKKDAKSGQSIIIGINCYGVTLDHEGLLYVSDVDNDLVMKYNDDFSRKEIVAGGNGKGTALNQLNRPHFTFVDLNFNLFVPDTDNHRIMKWSKGSTQGIVVSGNVNLSQLAGPHAIVADKLGTIYVVDHELHRVMRWLKGSQSGDLLFGGHEYGYRANQLALPVDIDFDRNGNLYVTDRNNHRIQMYAVNKTSCLSSSTFNV